MHHDENRVNTAASIKALLQPASIAIAGASADAGKLGSLPLAFLLKHGYAGKIYPLHPKLDEISGIRCHKSMAEIEGDVDLLVIAAAAARIPALLDECRPGQVKAALVLSSGFAELGAEGVQLQEALRTQAFAKGIRFVGPNSVGIANLKDKVVPSISQVFDQAGLAAGPIGFVSQSGAVGTAITALAHTEQIGIGYFVSTGNEGDLEFADFCDYFADDPAVSIIAGYVESIRDGDKFRAATAKAARAGKPVILIKVGTSDVGVRAVHSHTGALAGAEDVYRAAFSQQGVIRVQSIEELIDQLKIFSAFSRFKANSKSGGRVAILTHSGGAGVLMADTSIAEGMDVAAPSAKLVDALKLRLPPFASFQNPVDMTAAVVFDAELMANCMRDVMQSGEYDAVMLCVNLIWRQGPKLAAELSKLAAESKVLLGIAWIAAKQEPLDVLNSAGLPVFPDPVRCAKAIATRLRWHLEQSKVLAGIEPPARKAQAASSEDLGKFEIQAGVLKQYAVEVAPYALCGSPAEGQAAASRMGYPVVAKLVASKLMHKSDIGGVLLNIGSDQQLKEAFATLGAIAVPGKQGILVQKMVSGALEVFAGMKRDAVFGPVIVAGLGGIYVEIIRETVMRLAPFGEEQAERLLRSAKFFPLLDGARGRPKLAVAALAGLLSRVSYLACDQPSIVALDLNPVIVTETGVQVVDFKIELLD
jgi:acetyltransferase